MSDEEGFTLIEVMVSLTILIVIAVTTLATLTTVLRSTSDDRARVAAANLAAREIETVRSAFLSPTQGPDSIPLGQVVNGAPLPGGTAGNALVVDNHSYTVTRTTEWQTQGATAGPCDGGASGALAYLRVSVKVTWADIGSTVPVTAATLLTPPLGTYNAGTGHIKAKVLDQAGAPEPGTLVTLTGPTGAFVDSQITASDGCAFFAFLDLGSYTVTVSRAGYLDPTWAATPSQPITVVSNAATSATFSYAQAAITTFTFSTGQPAYTPALATKLTVYNPALTSTLHTVSYPSSVPSRTLTTWPYSDGVVAWRRRLHRR